MIPVKSSPHVNHSGSASINDQPFKIPSYRILEEGAFQRGMKQPNLMQCNEYAWQTSCSQVLSYKRSSLQTVGHAPWGDRGTLGSCVTGHGPAPMRGGQGGNTMLSALFRPQTSYAPSLAPPPTPFSPHREGGAERECHTSSLARPPGLLHPPGPAPLQRKYWLCSNGGRGTDRFH